MKVITPTHQKDICFYVEEDPIAALEQALAIIRRLGLELRNMRTQSNSKGLAVHVCVCAEDENVIITCRKRLQNVIGIFDVQTSDRTGSALRSPSLTPSDQRPVVKKVSIAQTPA